MTDINKTNLSCVFLSLSHSRSTLGGGVAGKFSDTYTSQQCDYIRGLELGLQTHTCIPQKQYFLWPDLLGGGPGMCYRKTNVVPQDDSYPLGPLAIVAQSNHRYHC